jgi:hypothetical protein
MVVNPRIGADARAARERPPLRGHDSRQSHKGEAGAASPLINTGRFTTSARSLTADLAARSLVLLLFRRRRRLILPLLFPFLLLLPAGLVLATIGCRSGDAGTQPD